MLLILAISGVIKWGIISPWQSREYCSKIAIHSPDDRVKSFNMQLCVSNMCAGKSARQEWQYHNANIQMTSHFLIIARAWLYILESGDIGCNDIDRPEYYTFHSWESRHKDYYTVRTI